MLITEKEENLIKSQYSGAFPYIFHKLGISLVIATYQAHKLITLYVKDDKMEMISCPFDKPMGLATKGEKLAVGTNLGIWELRNSPSLQDQYDAYYAPRNYYVTGRIQVHEMGYADDELWFVNTAYSCLCTLDPDYNFRPRWQPKFISRIVKEDRCHLNGLSIVNNKPKYVTAFGIADSKDGWRENKAHGGVLIDVESKEIIAANLSMPHSPRWYDGRLWLLESGHGSLVTVDLDTGKIETVVKLPGFTRGLDFYGPFAFVGLSQTRKQKIFSNIPLTERLEERSSGVWIVDINTGFAMSFLQFQDKVREISDVKILPGIRYPEMISHGSKQIKNLAIFPD
ncbi:TIGR03032 family protein [Xenococcus sp. PCC 7305]|uniref:TIGR03032 family protein n=1 Tax=Xenococcus sp. PCC 7305 TaxID=102125 RepID=UPI0002AC4C6D|nr:TIGR03032 family protein [Xenococcus sp. PCC 7305]ELS05341.1 TIGR03032 family protein [Xenococcus sp. PCC 7305]